MYSKCSKVTCVKFRAIFCLIYQKALEFILRTACKARQTTSTEIAKNYIQFQISQEQS